MRALGDQRDRCCCQMTPTQWKSSSDLSTQIARQKTADAVVEYYPSQAVGTGIWRYLFSVEDRTAPRSPTLFSPSETCGRDHEVLQANT